MLQINFCVNCRSKLTTCPRQGHLFSFQLNSTATSNGSEPKLENNLWHDSEMIGFNWNKMFESNVETCIDGTSFAFWFQDFWAISYWKELSTVLLTNHQLLDLSWFWRSVLIFKFLVLVFLRSLSCLISIEPKLCEEKVFQLQSKLNAIICIYERFAVKNSGISCLALIFNLSSLAILKWKPSGKDWFKVHTLFFLVEWFQLMALWLWRVTVSLATLVYCQQGAEALCCPMTILCSTEPVSGLTQAPLYCSLILFLHSLVSGDLVLTGFQLFTWTSDFHTWIGALGQDPATWTGLEEGQWLQQSYSLELLSLKTSQKPWPLFFLELAKKIAQNWKNSGPRWVFSKPAPLHRIWAWF